MRGFPFLFSDLLLSLTPAVRFSLLQTGILEANQCFQFFNTRVADVSLTALGCVFEKCSLPFYLKGSHQRLVLRQCRFLFFSTGCQLTNEPHPKFRGAALKDSGMQVFRKVLSTPPRKAERAPGFVEIDHCDFRSGRHVLKALNFRSRVVFSNSKVSRMYSRGLVLANCPEVEVTANKFVFNFHPKIFRLLKRLPWLARFVPHNRWPADKFDSEAEVRRKIFHSPFLVLICSENSNLVLADNFFAQNVGRVLLVQQNSKTLRRGKGGSGKRLPSKGRSARDSLEKYSSANGPQKTGLGSKAFFSERGILNPLGEKEKE